MAKNGKFKFNLLPKKSAAELALLDERDNSLFYSAAIVLFASFLWLLSSLFLSLVMSPRLQSSIAASKNVDLQISGFDTIRARNGELVYKVNLLKPLLGRKIDTNKIFTVADSLVKNVASARVTSYGRETAGKFVFRLVAQNFVDIARVVNNTKTAALQAEITDVELRDVIFDDSTNLVTGTIALNINGISTG